MNEWLAIAIKEDINIEFKLNPNEDKTIVLSIKSMTVAHVHTMINEMMSYHVFGIQSNKIEIDCKHTRGVLQYAGDGLLGPNNASNNKTNQSYLLDFAVNELALTLSCRDIETKTMIGFDSLETVDKNEDCKTNDTYSDKMGCEYLSTGKNCPYLLQNINKYSNQSIFYHLSHFSSFQATEI